MRDYKYHDLITEHGEWRAIMLGLKEIKSKCLLPCVEAYAANLDRMTIFAMLPTEFSFQIRRDEIIFQAAFAKVDGRAASNWREIVDRVITQPVAEEMERQIAEFEKLSKAEMTELRIALGVGYVETFLAANLQMQKSMDAILTFIVLDSWVAFECLVSDLWIAGVDNGGEVIMGGIHACDKWEKSEENIKAHQGITVSANAKTHPGSYLREIGKVSFQKWRTIKDYFRVAFGDGAVKIIEDTANGYTLALAQFRHCITHSAGTVDGHFVKQMIRFAEFNTLKVSDRILLDGDLVKRLRNASAETGLALIKYVDDMLQAGG